MTGDIRGETRILTLESTCDETAAAVITGELEVLSSVVASQDQLHQRFGGVVPEIASRAHLERILPVIDQALKQAGVALSDLSAVAVANTPGLAGSILVGLSAAKALCLALDVPLVAVNHLQAHVYACRLSAGVDVFPCVALIVSGGHTCLFNCQDALRFELLGATIDDAAGEAFDKVASMLRLPYPGGPSVQRAAEGGDPRAYRFPRPMLRDLDGLDFSFSGLKTAVRYAIAPPGKECSKIEPADVELEPHQVADIAASFQTAVVDVLIAKAQRALERSGYNVLCVGGGVACNAALRSRLEELQQETGIQVHIPPLRLCTDNAVMGAIAIERLQAGLIETLDLEARPGVVRAK